MRKCLKAGEGALSQFFYQRSWTRLCQFCCGRPSTFTNGPGGRKLQLDVGGGTRGGRRRTAGGRRAGSGGRRAAGGGPRAAGSGRQVAGGGKIERNLLQATRLPDQIPNPSHFLNCSTSGPDRVLHSSLEYIIYIYIYIYFCGGRGMGVGEQFFYSMSNAGT